MPALLVQTVLQRAPQQVPVAAGQAQRQQGSVGDVEDRVRERHLGRQRRAGRGRGHRLCGHDRERLESGGRLNARGLPVGEHDKAAVQGGRDVVGVPLERARLGEQVRVELEQVVGRHQAGDDRPRARAEAARRRDLRAYLEREPVRRMQALERPHTQVLAALLDQRLIALHGEPARLGYLEL